MNRWEAAEELREAGWPNVADDVEAGVSPTAILNRLRDIAEDDTDAAAIVAAIYED